VNLGLRQFYRQDVHPWVAEHWSDIRKIYVGPGWKAINGYERFGRVICGTLCLLMMVATSLMVPAMIIGFYWGMIDFFRFIILGTGSHAGP
jgi:hypothetical protein